MKRRQTENIGYVITTDTVIDFNALNNILDFSLKNNGDTNIIYTLNGVPYVLKTTDGMVSFLGYFNSYRLDVLKIKFTAPIGINPRVEVFATKETGVCDFDV